MKNTIILLILILLFSCNTDNKQKKILSDTKPFFISPIINKDSLLKLGMPLRTINQYSTVRTTEKYQNKSFFVVDTKENLIFFFDKNGKFVAKSPTIDGFDKQNKEKNNEALKAWSEHVSDIGFEWDNTKKQYIDTTKKNRVYSSTLVYNHLNVTKSRFFPKGVYKIVDKYHYNGFVGENDNTYDVNSMDNKNLSLAIHGLYQSQYRINNMNYLISLMGNDCSEIRVSEKFKKTILENDNNYMFNNSFGCINVPKRFLDMTKDMAVGSLVFVLGESNIDYITK